MIPQARSADGQPLAVGLSVWIAHGGIDSRTGQIKTVRGRITRIYPPSGRLVVARDDTGARAHGSAAGCYVLAPPMIRRVTTEHQLRRLVCGDDECRVCTGIIARSDIVMHQVPGTCKAVAYLRCMHCGFRAMGEWNYQDGIWQPGHVLELGADAPADRRAWFDRAISEARELATRRDVA
jgi:hypothetical protein